MRKLTIACSLAALAVAVPSEARKLPETGTPLPVQQLMSCRTIGDSGQRLACYDRQAEVLQKAISTRNVVVIDHERASAAKRSLFGFSIPDFGGLFGGGDSELNEIASTVAKVSKDPYGAWIVTLADGSTWMQTDDAQLGLAPERGDKIVVHRGSFGAFFLRVNGQPGIKVKRVG